jgi:short-subunit dehydrogenase
MTIIITGASSGLGLSITRTLESRGYPVVTCSRNPESRLCGDLRDPEFVASIGVFMKTHKVATLVHCAGVYMMNSLAESTAQEIKDVIDSNILGTALLFSEASKHFRDQQSGRIVVINSIAGQVPTERESVYGASKAAVSYLSKSLQLELLSYGVRVTEIFPGAIKTKMTKSRENYENLMEPEEISELIPMIIEKKFVSISSITVRNFRDIH